MKDLDYIRAWLFKGLSAQRRLDDLEEDGVAVRAHSDPGALQRVLPLEDFPPSVRQAAMKALPVYLAFFCLENAVRDLISERLSENHGANWWGKLVSNRIKAKVTKRQAEDGANRWHARRGVQEIYYTDFGDLTLIIQSTWSDFEDLFPDQNWITSPTQRNRTF